MSKFAHKNINRPHIVLCDAPSASLENLNGKERLVPKNLACHILLKSTEEECTKLYEYIKDKENNELGDSQDLKFPIGKVILVGDTRKTTNSLFKSIMASRVVNIAEREKVLYPNYLENRTPQQEATVLLHEDASASFNDARMKIRADWGIVVKVLKEDLDAGNYNFSTTLSL